MENMTVRPDIKGRINLGELTQGVSSYRISILENGQLLLIPYTEIPFSEKWIFDNEEVLEKVKQRLKKEIDDIH
jgi:hypothetical protein